MNERLEFVENNRECMADISTVSLSAIQNLSSRHEGIVICIQCTVGLLHVSISLNFFALKSTEITSFLRDSLRTSFPSHRFLISDYWFMFCAAFWRQTKFLSFYLCSENLIFSILCRPTSMHILRSPFRFVTVRCY